VITADQTSFEEAYEEHADLVRAEKTRPFPSQALGHFGLELISEDEFVLYAPRVTEADKLNDRKSLDRFHFSLLNFFFLFFLDRQSDSFGLAS